MKFHAPAAKPPAQPVRKPEGGYRLIGVIPVLTAWFCYEKKLISFRDLRVWFALHEMAARRCELEAGRSPQFGLDELRGLVGGVGGEHLRKSLQSLAKAGLGQFTGDSLKFAASPDAIPLPDLSEFWAMVEKVTNHRRKIPVPRRTLRLLAQTGRPAVIACVLAHLCRCVYARGGGIVSEGACKISWIVDVFGVGERQAKAAREFLRSINWLTGLDVPQWYRNRYGARVRVNLDWIRPDSYADEPSKTAPPPAFSTTKTAPPDIKPETSSRSKNQKPALAAERPTGFSIENQKEENQKAPPSLRDVQTSDLRDTPHLLTLFEQATQAALIASSDNDRLRFFTIAEHALVKGTKNPPGLFMHLLKNKLYHFATNDDEDAALTRLKRHFHGRDAKRESEKPRLVRVDVKLSDDAKFVAAVERVCRDRRIECDHFQIVKREKVEWTRERWNAAVAELEASRFAKWKQKYEWQDAR